MMSADNKSQNEIFVPQEICERAFVLIRDKQFEDAAKLLTNCMSKTEDPVAVGLFHSTLGVLEKARGDFKASLTHYQRAEKLLSEEPSLKLITARLLIDEMKDYAGAIKRCTQAMKLVPGHPVIAHHAKTLIGLARVGQGKRRSAQRMLEESIVDKFTNFVTARNIDFHLVEECVRREWCLDICKNFLQYARSFAESRHESTFVRSIDKILVAMEDLGKSNKLK